MFKRVEKRRLKKEEEEELGLDEDMKEILGMHDTDSEESASESGDSDDASEDEKDEEPEENDRDDVDEQFDEGMEAEDDGDSAADAEDDEDPNITVSQALEDPVYVISVLPEVKACIICPGKVLKGVKMVQLHRTSNAHERRLKQFKALSVDADLGESAWDILKRGAEEKPKLSLAPSASATSKRAEKKKASFERQKLRREKRKEKRIKEALKKKSLAAASHSETVPAEGSQTNRPETKKADKKEKMKKDPIKPLSTFLPKKKRKVESTMEPTQTSSSVPKSSTSDIRPVKRSKPQNSEAGSTPAAYKTPVAIDKESVKNIVRSTSDRAKNARERAMSASKGPKVGTTPRRKKARVS